MASSAASSTAAPSSAFSMPQRSETNDRLVGARGGRAILAEQVVNALHALSVSDPKYRKLKQLLAAWMNSYLHAEKMYVRDITEDLQDGQLLLSFLEKLIKTTLPIALGAQALSAKRSNLVTAFTVLRTQCQLDVNDAWIDGILNRDFVSITRLLVLLAHKFACPYQLPSDVTVVVIHREVTADESIYGEVATATLTANALSLQDGGRPSSRPSRPTFQYVRALEAAESTSIAALPATSSPSLSFGMDRGGVIVRPGRPRDAFDDLFQPGMADKLQHVNKLLLNFVNKHLELVSMNVTDLGSDLSDGVSLILLIGVLGGMFVPLYNYKSPATSNEEKYVLWQRDNDQIANVQLAFRLLDSMQISANGIAVTDIVGQDLRATMRLVYRLFVAFQTTRLT